MDARNFRNNIQTTALELAQVKENTRQLNEQLTNLRAEQKRQNQEELQL